MLYLSICKLQPGTFELRGLQRTPWDSVGKAKCKLQVLKVKIHYVKR